MYYYINIVPSGLILLYGRLGSGKLFQSIKRPDLVWILVSDTRLEFCVCVCVWTRTVVLYSRLRAAKKKREKDLILSRHEAALTASNYRLLHLQSSQDAAEREDEAQLWSDAISLHWINLRNPAPGDLRRNRPQEPNSPQSTCITTDAYFSSSVFPAASYC